MNRRYIITAVLFLLSISILSGCRSDGPSGTDITSGVWYGPVYTADAWEEGPVVLEFSDGGNFRMGDYDDIIIYDEAINQDFTWSLDENYLTVTGFAYMYFAQFAYELSEDGSHLTLVLIQRNFFNDTYDDMDCGDRFYLSRDEEGYSFSDFFGSDSILETSSY